jgi:glyoxylate reductase
VTPAVAVARELLPAGLELLEERYAVRSGGLDAGRAEILALVEGADGVVADATVAVDGELLDRAGPRLRVVANFAVGFDAIDLAACAARGVVVTNTPGVLTGATAELGVALSLAAVRGLFEASADLRDGKWSNWAPAGYCGPQVSGSLVGVVGMGRIGEEYARMMRGLGAEIVYWNRSAKPRAEDALGARRVGSLEELMEQADIISVHAAATPETHHLIDAAMLARVKPTAVLVNTARGSVVDEHAVAAALREGRLWAAGLDVFENEPEVPDDLLQAPRAVLLPHIGSATRRTRDEMSRLVARNVIAVLEGEEPPTPVNPPAGE